MNPKPKATFPAACGAAFLESSLVHPPARNGADAFESLLHGRDPGARHSAERLAAHGKPSIVSVEAVMTKHPHIIHSMLTHGQLINLIHHESE